MAASGFGHIWPAAGAHAVGSADAILQRGQAPIHLAVASHQFSGGCVMATLSNFWRFLFAGHWYASFKARDKNG